jgi:hypothetical protein
MRYLITLLLLGFASCSSSISDVPMAGETSTGLNYELALMDASVRGSVQLISVTSAPQGDMSVVEYQLYNSDALGEKRVIATWEWRDATGMSVHLDGTAQQARQYAIDSQGYLTISNSSPSTNASSVVLRLKSQ